MSASSGISALEPERLRRRLDPGTLPFETTADAPPLDGTIGQSRAIGAIDVALHIPNDGFNLFVAGAPGSGRESTVVDYLHGIAAGRQVPSDWVYVYGFADADHPNAIQLPPGRGVAFARDMAELVARATQEVARAFRDEVYDRRRRDVLSAISERRAELFARLDAFARDNGFALEATQAGVTSVPIVNDEPLTPAAFAALSEEQRADIDRRGRLVQEQIGATMHEAHALDREVSERLLALEQEVTLFAIGPLLDHLRREYAGIDDIITHIDAVQRDLIRQYQHLRDAQDPPATQQEGAPPVPARPAAAQAGLLARYDVNVLVDHSRSTGAPVVIERNPTYYNLIGRMDYYATPSGMVTDFRQIKPGALHLANGGFLILHATDVLRHPLAWEALKRSLTSREIRVEAMGEQSSPVPTASLRPEPIPLDVKVILIGSALQYRLLFSADDDFEELFKVKAEFAPDMRWTDEHVEQYVSFISRWVRDNGLKHLTAAAVARVVEHGARLRDHQQRLSTRMRSIADLVTEASHWAEQAGHALIEPEDVDRAIAMKAYRSNLVEERLDDLIADGTIDIDTSGERVGQVNGLSVIDVGDHAFGKPTRVTARVSVGNGQILSVDRETLLSGRIHSKGFLILSGYLMGQYAHAVPVAASASITFEQSYDEIDGDSASSAELYALLSALSGVPIRQGIAVTGSVNQFGQVQAVGGVTHKIEGFFDVCRVRGLTGDQGIIIPASNVQNLMLSDHVVEAARDGQFRVWAVTTVDEGIELLTGRPAGQLRDDGTYPPGTIHALVQERLHAYAEIARHYAVPNLSP